MAHVTGTTGNDTIIPGTFSAGVTTDGTPGDLSGDDVIDVAPQDLGLVGAPARLRRGGGVAAVDVHLLVLADPDALADPDPTDQDGQPARTRQEVE